MANRELRELWAELDAELTSLRSAFDASPLGATTLKYFDESLEANEYGVALDALCDFLANAQTPSVEADLLARMEALYAKMGCESECLARLRQKAR